MFKLGDRVRFKTSQKKELIEHYTDNTAVVVDLYQTSTKQFCRINFGKGMFDYKDVGSWRLERTE